MHSKNRYSILMMLCLALGLWYLWQETAEAARLGGSRSFGSRPSYQRSAPPPSQSMTQPRANSGQAAQQKPTAGPSPSPFGRWGGMLGGFLMGGLLGSLLFGGGRAFAGPGLMDILLVVGGVFLLMRFLRSRQSAAQATGGGQGLAFEGGPSAGPSADSYFRPSEQPAAAAEYPPLPSGFEADEFLKGATTLYNRLQASWDKRELDDIRQFASPEVFQEIQKQAQEDPRPGKTELLLVTPKLIEVREINDKTVASVLYDVMMREQGDQLAKQVRELWHFSRTTQQPDSFWMLEGIQQVE